jgi:hypothetical protein
MSKNQKPAGRNKNSPEVAEYSGPLAEPTYPLSLLDMCSEERVQEWIRQRTNKMDLLLSHYGIDPTGEDCWRKLALALAKRHVPGFRPPPPERGRPLTRKEDDVTLVWLVYFLKRRDLFEGRNLGDREACKEIADKGLFKGNAETLRTRYRETRSRWELHGVWETQVNFLDRILSDIEVRKGKDTAVRLVKDTIDNIVSGGSDEDSNFTDLIAHLTAARHHLSGDY